MAIFKLHVNQVSDRHWIFRLLMPDMNIFIIHPKEFVDWNMPKSNETLISQAILQETIAIVEIELSTLTESNVSFRNNPNELILHSFYVRHKTSKHFLQWLSLKGHEHFYKRLSSQRWGIVLLKQSLEHLLNHGIASEQDNVIAHPCGSLVTPCGSLVAACGSFNGSLNNDVALTRYYLKCGFYMIDETYEPSDKNKHKNCRHFIQINPQTISEKKLKALMDMYGYSVGSPVQRIIQTS